MYNFFRFVRETALFQGDHPIHHALGVTIWASMILSSLIVAPI